MAREVRETTMLLLASTRVDADVFKADEVTEGVRGNPRLDSVFVKKSIRVPGSFSSPVRISL
jgi:hypothetical protein